MWDLLRYKNNVAVVEEDGTARSYPELYSHSAAVAQRMGGRKLVFILCSNTYASLYGYVGCLNARIVPALLDAHLDRALLASLTQKYSPEYIWAPDEAAAELGYACEFSAHGYSLLRTGLTGSALYDELALLLTTSGSTGSPKLVRQSYKNVESNTRSIVEYLELDETERPITTLPMSYTYGLSIINSHLWAGASVIVTQKALMNREFWQQFREYGATSFGGVPYIYEMLDKLRFFRMDLPSLRTMTQAGGKLSPELHKKFAEYAMEKGKRFVVMYGQTEATARMAYLPYERSLEKYGSMGIAIPGGRFTLIDANGKVVSEPEVTGELVYEGDNVTLGYAECGADLIKGDERHGRLETGDMAKFDADGFYYIVGRKKRFLKIFGSRTNLDEAEMLLKGAFPDMSVACGGVDDKMWVFITDGTKKEEALRFLSDKLHFNSAAFNVCVVEHIPKNESGKTLYTELEKYYK